MHVTISNIELIGPLNEILTSFVRVIHTDREQVESEPRFLLVSKAVEVVVVSDDVLDRGYFFSLV